ncbi:MAG: TonB family protein, partial [Muribaculaceae bacterium]
MNTFPTYMLQSAIVMVVLYLPYVLLLHREKFPRVNRLVLLFILLASVLLPLVDVPTMAITLPQSMPKVTIGLPTAIGIVGAEQTQADTFSVDRLVIIAALSLLGTAINLGIRLVQIMRMRRAMVRGCLWKQCDEGIHIYCHNGEVAPFSWMNCIVIGEADYNENGKFIIMHEKGHIRAHHSIDMLLLMVIEALQWWNPIVYLMGRSLREVHEYEADDYVLHQGISAKQYQLLLIKKAVGAGSYTFANNFNYSLTKNRISMMQKKSNKQMLGKVLYLIPATALTISAFATVNARNATPSKSTPLYDKGSEKIEFAQTPSQSAAVAPELATSAPKVIKPAVAETDKHQANKAEVVKSQNVAKESSVANNEVTDDEKEVVKVPDQLPKYPGGMRALRKKVAELMQYPSEAFNAGIQGTVVVQFTIKEDGNVSDVKVLRSIHPLLDEESVRVVKLLN